MFAADLHDAAVAEADCLTYGAVAHAGLARCTDGGVAGRARLVVVGGDPSESFGVVGLGHAASVENLTSDSKSCTKLDMPIAEDGMRSIDSGLPAPWLAGPIRSHGTAAVYDALDVMADYPTGTAPAQIDGGGIVSSDVVVAVVAAAVVA